MVEKILFPDKMISSLKSESQVISSELKPSSLPSKVPKDLYSYNMFQTDEFKFRAYRVDKTVKLILKIVAVVNSNIAFIAGIIGLLGEYGI